MWLDSFDKEYQYRKEINPDKLCTYGVEFLDNSLTCILPNDLVVIGAETGTGKSELSLQIASHNAKKGRKVALFFLEGGDVEAMARMKWRDLCIKYRKENPAKFMPVGYVEWRTNRFPDKETKDLFHRLEQDILIDYGTSYMHNLYIPEINGTFSLDNLQSDLLGFHTLKQTFETGKQYDLDLIVIDHLQYFDLTSQKGEIDGTTQILKTCKEITDQHKVPVVLVSHLRKLGKEGGIPSHEDFYGTGNISKISSTSIIIAKDGSQTDFSYDKYFTYFRIVKSRIGISSNIVSKLVFDGKTRSYEKEYTLYNVSDRGFVAKEPIDYKLLPKWAKEASNPPDTELHQAMEDLEQKWA